MKKTASFTLAAMFAASAAAQSPAGPHPADPKAGVAMQPYESAFRDYRPYSEPEVGRWREANKEVGRLGGHSGHSRRSPDTAKPAAKPPAGLHGDHK